MPARTLSLTAGSLLLAAISFAPPAFAAPGDDTAPPVEVESARNSFPGIVNSNAVYVRSGPAESYYPTLKLDKGSRVTVVGMKLDWLKIVPPEGSFCYISKAFVDRSGDGTVGKVNKDSVNVRAGSTLNSLKVVPLCQLSVGMEVKILGEQDEYFKIAPPDGKAFVYINKQFVEPDPAAKPKPIDPPTQVPPPPTVAKDNTKPANNGGVAQVPPTPDNAGPILTTNPDHKMPNEGPEAKPGPEADPTSNEPKAIAGATTRPASDAVAGATTQPSADDAATVEATFEKAELAYAAGEKQQLEVPVINDLIKQYEQLVASPNLTNTLHRIAETRLENLKIRADAAARFAEAKAAQESMVKKDRALKAEREELEQRLATVGVSIYTAVGELQSSSLQIGSKTLYRLTDPANGRTVCYVRSDDGKIVKYMGKFIGVKGELTTESQLSLKVIAPTDFGQVDPGKVNHGVTATVIPPSMIAAQEASTASHEQQP